EDKVKKEKNKQIWNDLSSILKLREDERLCGVCLTKRLFPEIVKDEFNLSDDIRFPSTSEMASIGEKRRLDDNTKNDIKVAYENFVSLVKKKNNNRRFPETVSILKLKNDPLYKIDGQFLMKETYNVDYLKKEYGLQVNEDEFQDILKILQNNKINPSKYYAILQMDGDNMGKWLRGEFNPEIGNTIHEKVKDALIAYSDREDIGKLQKILCSKHPTSPSIHQAFSRRLSIFALDNVRKIVEEDHYGKLVYAGGDDVLALLPIEEALNCAYDLQKTFKEALSPEASMSAGIVIIHYKYPLYLALEEVNSAEKRAKKHYGKNAFCLRFFSRSGEQRECGGNWELVEFMNELIYKLKIEEISSSFPYDYLKVVEGLYDENEKDDKGKVREILKSELKRVFFRKVEDKEKIRKFFEEKILKWFEKLDVLTFANVFIIARVMEREIRV
ncbi:MAG TPA: type III-B CRISPR-associated protein Cas10/Cmr2, partial [Thermodesulfobium narugense]|nr:type III-B CRISPR-associated protein Cas10/Cmr2 [Thermodesulfobium narugense]